MSARVNPRLFPRQGPAWGRSLLGTPALLTILGGCRLPADTEPGAVSNVVVAGGYAYATLAERGLGVYALPEGRLVRSLPPPEGSESVDDLAVDGELLFVLDAKSPGHLAVLSLDAPELPALVAPSVPVPVGPFSGVSAARGRAIVSGGTSDLTVWRYDEDGRLDPEPSSLDLGRGQPDVLIAPDGEHAFVSTHFSLLADTFGLSVMAVEPPRALGALELEGAGFSPGGRRPANFPIEMALAGDRLLVAYGEGLAIVDVADAAAPRLESVLPLGLAGVSVDADGSRAVVVGSSPEPALVEVDLAAVGGPRVRSRAKLPSGSEPTGVAIADGTACVAAQGGGLVAVPLR